MEEIGRRNTHARYLKTLSSAYSCRADFDIPTYFQNDLPLIGSPAGLGGFTRFSSSPDMDTPDSGKYGDLLTAINILLYAGGLPLDKDPTIAKRAEVFSPGDLGDIHAQLMYMLMAELGRFLYFYGNSSLATGVKGSGIQGNTCLMDYENVALDVGVDIQTSLGLGLTGACVDRTSGHADMTPINISRLCEGVVLFNNLLVILPAVINSITVDDFDNFDALKTIQTLIEAAKIVLTTAKPETATLTNVLSQAKCATDNEADDDFIQVYYALYLEKLLQ